jgi:hypothetical protein
LNQIVHRHQPQRDHRLVNVARPERRDSSDAQHAAMYRAPRLGLREQLGR